MIHRRPFRESNANAFQQVMAVHSDGEWTIIPMAVNATNVNNQRNTPDPARPSFQLCAIFANEPRTVKAGEEILFSTNEPEVHFRRCDLKETIRRGDWLRREADGSTWEMSDVQTDSLDGVCVKMSRLGRERL